MALLCLAACARQAEPTAAKPSNQAQAEIGRLAFFDASLSASGRMSCATCHSPDHAYGPPNALAVQLGGPELKDHGTRAVPSLRYLRRTPIWFKTFTSNARERLTETDNVPVGGFTWDGRFNTLAEQATAPLLAANEMANPSVRAVVERLARSAYAARFREVFGQDIFSRPEAAFAALGQALQRFQLDDASFQPYSSKFDQYLDGRAQLSAQEQRGLKLFKDRDGGNCAACHTVEPGANGAHPLLTDFSFAAVGVPRNPDIPANADPNYYDMGLCGPVRSDQQAERAYCGLFKTPTLRNVATRGAFFHNGRFHTLEEALRFYVERDTAPQKWYLHAGSRRQFDDLPEALQDNVDHINAPFTRHKGDRPVWSQADIRDVMAFLKTLNDGDIP
ncbi:cytochrome-c peroxidase [Ralstonia insidiosa]|uniref:cytochrome-c peroxidase n=1 Tax=Ralstonia insidiosa TaxID=190721 RepID=UPI001E44B51C|nr:cytochrome c peroxidase [Ralstonia insidiosa]